MLNKIDEGGFRELLEESDDLHSAVVITMAVPTGEGAVR
jgi:hypothetical protein